MTTSKRLYVYLQRPDTGAWVTVGVYKRDTALETGVFRYAPSYVDAGLYWSIDPVNLPFLPDVEINAPRYRGLPDALRDACPDAWGKLLMQREHNLPDNTHDSEYLRLARNDDRWGALAFGASPKPPRDIIQSPQVPKLDVLVGELTAIHERRPPIDARIRKRLMATSSMGGARPKATIREGDAFWIVKPVVREDIVDVPLLEHFAQQWGRASGLNFADTCYHGFDSGLSALRVLRFDRQGAMRRLVISGASLLSTEYPGNLESATWSYPRMAEELLRIGAPEEDLKELFGRMLFNAIAGNDDDHPRNHAAIFCYEEGRWRLSPAYDVVPNAEEHPKSLVMQLSLGRFDISREAVLGDSLRFGFSTRDEAQRYMDELISKILIGYEEVCGLLSQELKKLMDERLNHAAALLSIPRELKGG